MGRSGKHLINGRSLQVTNIRQLSNRINDLRSDLAGRMATDVLREAAGTIKSAAQANAKSSGVPEEVVESIFNFADPQARNKKGLLTALAGVNKQRTMKATWKGDKFYRIPWIATDHPKSPRAKVSAGRKVAMSVAAMYEFGTSSGIEATAYFRKAVESCRTRVRDIIADGFTEILKKHGK